LCSKGKRIKGKGNQYIISTPACVTQSGRLAHHRISKPACVTPALLRQQAGSQAGQHIISPDVLPNVPKTIFVSLSRRIRPDAYVINVKRIDRIYAI
jgi:hypothetical protein